MAVHKGLKSFDNFNGVLYARHVTIDDGPDSESTSKLKFFPLQPNLKDVSGQFS